MANIFAFIVKTEGQEKTYLKVGEHGDIYTSKFMNYLTPQELNYVFKKLEERDPVPMGNSLSLPTELHRISGICNAKPECEFKLEYVIANVDDMTLEVIRTWQCHLKQWPDGFVKILKN